MLVQKPANPLWSNPEMEIRRPEIMHRLTLKVPEAGLVYKMKKAMKEDRRRNNSNKVSDLCTRMLPYGNLEIDPLGHHDSLLERLREKPNHMLEMTATLRSQTFTILMLQESEQTKTTAVLELRNFSTNKVNLHSTCKQPPDSTLTQILMQLRMVHITPERSGWTSIDPTTSSLHRQVCRVQMQVRTSCHYGGQLGCHASGMGSLRQLRHGWTQRNGLFSSVQRHSTLPFTLTPRHTTTNGNRGG